MGTTDTPIDHPSYELRPFDQEIEFILETASLYLSRPPKREDILSIYAGIRPLVKVPGNHKTKSLSRDHTIHIDDSGLLTIVGGKWTTYRHMAADCVNHANTNGDLKDSPCVTFDLKVHGYYEPSGVARLASSLWIGRGRNSSHGRGRARARETAASAVALHHHCSLEATVRCPSFRFQV